MGVSISYMDPMDIQHLLLQTKLNLEPFLIVFNSQTSESFVGDVCQGLNSTPYIGDKLITPLIGNPYNGYYEIRLMMTIPRKTPWEF